jgi:hypothetical protein
MKAGTRDVAVPELSSDICHVNRIQIAQDNSGTMMCNRNE